MRDEGDDGGYVLPGREPFAAFAATRSGRDTRRLVTELMHPRSPHRGLLLFHAVGTGKTCVAIAALHAWLRTGREVLVLTPAGLRANFLREMTGNVCGVFRSPSG